MRTQTHPRQHLIQRHDQILATVAAEFRRLGFDVIKSGYEAGGQPYDPDLYVRQPAGGLGFYLDIKHPDGPNVAIDLDPWLHFRILGDVLVLSVWSDGRCALVDIDRARPTFWGAADDDRIPVLAAAQLIKLDVPYRQIDRGDPKQTSNKPFIIYRARRTYGTLGQALAALLRKAGVSGG